MTKEEAIRCIEDHISVHRIGKYPHIRLAEALDMAVSALRDKKEHGWVSVMDELPKREKELEPWKRYNVAVLRSHWPTSSYDPCDAPYDEESVTTAAYDSEQKIWHLDWGEQLNALIGIEDSPLNGDYVTHWMPLPEPPMDGINGGDAV